MTPEDLAALHPRLFHLTAPEALPGIERHGLLSARNIVERTGADPTLLSRRRAREVPIERAGDRYVLNDNIPLSEATLARVLDDAMTPADWLRHLNGRVFFWVDEDRLARLRGAATNRDRDRAVLVLDTLSLARAHGDRMSLSPINSGATGRSPARRGRNTFTPLAAHSYDAWRRLRRPGRALDRIAEVTVEDAVPDAMKHVLEVRHWEAGARRMALNGA